jgi:hypothetical protein
VTDFQLNKEINSLPAELKKEVSDFVAFLKGKTKPGKRIRQRQFGYAKGFFKMAKDFDAPLDDFKEYV